MVVFIGNCCCGAWVGVVCGFVWMKKGEEDKRRKRISSGRLSLMSS